MMKKQKDLRNWRIKKIAMYIVSAVLFVLGIIVLIQSFLSGEATKDAWKFILGFAIFAAGLLVFAEAWNESFKDHLRNKRTR